MKRHTRGRAMQPKALRLCAALVLIAALAGPAKSAQQIQTGPISNVAFQALVDTADSGDTLVLAGGVYDFTSHAPVRITKSLDIVAEDPNNPPIFEGSGLLFGTPPTTGNTAFFVRDLSTDIRGLRFSGLVFTDFERTLSFSPELDDFGFLVAGGILSQLTIENCRFSESRRGIQIFGGNVEQFDFRDNQITDVQQGILVVGGVFGTPTGEVLGSGVRNGLILGNEISGSDSAIGILVAGGQNVLVTSNEVVAGAIGIGLGDDTASFFPDAEPAGRVGSVVGNSVSGGLIGLWGFGPTGMSGVSYTGNSVSNSFVGTLLEEGANHCLIANTTNEGNMFDYWLGGDSDGFAFPPATHDNRVIADFGDAVENNGIDNSIDGPYNAIENPHVPDDVQARLIELASALEALREP